LKKNETVERREERQRDAAEAMAEYRSLEEGIAAKMARLKALRLSRAADVPQTHPPRELLSATTQSVTTKPVADSARRSTVRKRAEPKAGGLGAKLLSAKLSSAKALGTKSMGAKSMGATLAETSSKRSRAKKAS